jgi:hypothetical protein
MDTEGMGGVPGYFEIGFAGELDFAVSPVNQTG